MGDIVAVYRNGEAVVFGVADADHAALHGGVGEGEVVEVKEQGVDDERAVRLRLQPRRETDDEVYQVRVHVVVNAPVV